MNTNTNDDYFADTFRNILVHGTDLARRLHVVAPEAAAWDGVPQARLALESRHGGFSYCEVKATGRSWRAAFGGYRYTVRVRFMRADEHGNVLTTDWMTGEEIRSDWTEEKPTFGA